MPWTAPARAITGLTPVERWLALLVLAFALAAGWAAAARAQSIESVLSPGKLIQGHLKWDDDCKACHVKFDRAAQDRLCMDCHKDIGQDVRAKAGHHGRLKPQACNECHTDHKGRSEKIAACSGKGSGQAVSGTSSIQAPCRRRPALLTFLALLATQVAR